jgi:hypothetical protein
MKMVLFILQNAYKSEKHQFKNEEEWSNELNNSQTGRRLKELIPENVRYRVINASDIIGDNVDSCFDPNLNHLKAWINVINPDVIVACGKVAQKGCDLLDEKYIKAPHPAWRALSKLHTTEIRKQIASAVTQ